MSTLLSVSIAVLAGLLMTRVFNLWRLPDVTAYLVAGVLIGPYVLGSMHITGLGLVSAEAVSSLHLVSEVALGFIAFSIGNEFRAGSAGLSAGRWHLLLRHVGTGSGGLRTGCLLHGQAALKCEQTAPVQYGPELFFAAASSNLHFAPPKVQGTPDAIGYDLKAELHEKPREKPLSPEASFP